MYNKNPDVLNPIYIFFLTMELLRLKKREKSKEQLKIQTQTAEQVKTFNKIYEVSVPADKNGILDKYMWMLHDVKLEPLQS